MTGVPSSEIITGPFAEPIFFTVVDMHIVAGLIFICGLSAL